MKYETYYANTPRLQYTARLCESRSYATCVNTVGHTSIRSLIMAYIIFDARERSGD